MIKENLIDKFLQNKNYQIINKHSYLSGIGATITEVETSYDGEGFVFINLDEIRTKGRFRGSIGSDYDEELNLEWQKYVVRKTYGIEHDVFVNNFINTGLKKLEHYIENMVDWYNDNEDLYFKDQQLVETYVDHLLDLEEVRFSRFLNDAKTDADFRIIVQGRQNQRCAFLNLVENKKQELLNKIDRSYNENGEQVYNFSEQELELYEFLKEIEENIDFAFRHQIYRLDQKEYQINESEK